MPSDRLVRLGFWTDVRNWALDPDVESVEIDGPFAAGTRGYTNSKSSGRIEWSLAEASDHRAVIEFPLPGALGRCAWTFQDTAGYTLITQRWTLQGEQAPAYVQTIAPSLEAGKLGFPKVAHFNEVGFKFDRWIDVGYGQLNFPA